MTAFGDPDKEECGAVQTLQKREYLEMVHKIIKSGNSAFRSRSIGKRILLRCNKHLMKMLSLFLRSQGH